MLTQVVQSLVDTHIAKAGGDLAEASAISIDEIGEGKSLVFQVSATVNGVQLRWVAKQTTLLEVSALKALNRAGIENIPELLAYHHEGVHWYILMPEYPGHHGDFGDSIDPSILRCLARIHVNFRGIPTDLEGKDKTTLERVFEESLGDLNIYPNKTIRKDLDRVRAAAEGFGHVAERFSQTFVHWDVHPGNIVVQGKDSVLIDWGSTGSGPAMIDLANLVKWGSPDFHTYVRAVEEFSEERIRTDFLLSEYEWARAIIQIRYLPYAAKIGDEEHMAVMTKSALDYAISIGWAKA